MEEVTKIMSAPEVPEVSEYTFTEVKTPTGVVQFKFDPNNLNRAMVTFDCGTQWYPLRDVEMGLGLFRDRHPII